VDVFADENKFRIRVLEVRSKEMRAELRSRKNERKSNEGKFVAVRKPEWKTMKMKREEVTRRGTKIEEKHFGQKYPRSYPCLFLCVCEEKYIIYHKILSHNVSQYYYLSYH
jgi:hypothetical protein